VTSEGYYDKNLLGLKEYDFVNYVQTTQQIDTDSSWFADDLMAGNQTLPSMNNSDFLNETLAIGRITDLSDLKDILGNVKQTLDEGAKLTDSVVYSLIAIYCLVIFVGVLGNILILWAVLGRDAMRTGRNVFIGTLAASDLFLCIFTMPSTLWEVRKINYFALPKKLFVQKFVNNKMM
jgi:hypothetical protein